MQEGVSHSRQEETLEAKARWFQSLSLQERMETLCDMTDLILEHNPKTAEKDDAQPTALHNRTVPMQDWYPNE
jgi:hypothetical protein